MESVGRSGETLLFLTSDFPPQSGGISRYSLGLAQNLARHYRKVIVLVERTESVTETRLTGVEVEEVVSGRFYPARVWRLLRASLRISRREDLRRVMVSSWSPAGVAVWLLSYLRDIDYYVGAHGLDILEPLRSRKYSFLMRRTLGRAARVFPVSRFTKNCIERLGVEPGKVIAIPNGVDLERFIGVKDVDDIVDRHHLHGKQILLTVSRLVRRKGHDLVVEALKVLAPRYPDLVYVIVGEGPEKTPLQELVSRYSLVDRVFFADFVPDAEIPKYNLLCDLFVMPVRELAEAGDVEGFGIVFLEANACGKPVIGSRSGGVEDAILENRTGLLVEPDDIEQLIDAISKLLENEGLCQELGNNGRERVFTQLNWEHSVRIMVREMGLTANA